MSQHDGLRSALDATPRCTAAPHQDRQASTSSFLQVVSAFDVHEAAANGDGDRVRPVVCSELTDKVLDVIIHCRFGDVQLVRDLFVSMAVAYQLEDVQLTRRQMLLSEMLCQP